MMNPPPSLSPDTDMSMPENELQDYLQQQQPQQQSKPVRDTYDNFEVQIQRLATFCQNLHDHSPYIPQFHIVGFAPGPVPGSDGSDGGVGYGLERNRMRPKEQDFLEPNTNSQISSVDFLQQPLSVSTGLGLSLDNGRLDSSSTVYSSFITLIGDDIDRELQRHYAEIDRIIKLQGDRLRQAVLQIIQANQLQIISYIEDNYIQKLNEKEAEIDDIDKKNMELESQLENLVIEALTWQQRAKYSENLINNLKFNLQQVYAQSRDSKEGCGDSEVDDTASCCNGRASDFHLLFRKGNDDMKELMTCKVCRVNQVCMLLLPCKHLCLCKECESQVSTCPLCQSSKYIGMEVYI